MLNKLIHFALYTEDIKRAQAFYQGVFNWGFSSYGQDDFLQIKSDNTEQGELIGALQDQKYSPLKEKVIGAEGTIAVESVDKVILAVKKHGGKIVLDKTAIPQVGWITKFLDTEGNLICAMEYNQSAQ